MSSLLYFEEHSSCNNFISVANSGFSLKEVSRGERIYCHDNKYNVLLFLLKGKLEVEKNGESYIMSKGTVMLFDSNQIDFSLTALSDSDIVFHYFDIPIQFCERLAIESLASYLSSMTVDDIIHVMDIEERLLDCFLVPLQKVLSDKARCKHFFEIKHQELFFFFRFYYSKQNLAYFFYPLISSSLDFKQVVYANYDKAHSAKHLAELCHYGENQFRTEFIRNFSETPYAWFNKRRMDAVKARLADKNISFSDIIAEFQFSSPAHFTTYCKKNFGMTPKLYRRQIIENTLSDM